MTYNTTNLFNHLRRHHAAILKAVQQAQAVFHSGIRPGGGKAPPGEAMGPPGES
jgi:hypothetical protein